MTGAGGLLMVAAGPADDRRQNLLVGFAAGVMIAAAFFSLIIPAFDQMGTGGVSVGLAAAGVATAVWLGAAVMGRLGLWAESVTDRGLGWTKWGNGADAAVQRRIALFVLAITLHNLPEGAAVGLSFMSSDPALGWATMLGIGIQNIPEGMAVAALLASLGWSRMACAGAALATGLVEPIGGAVAVAVAEASAAVLPWALGFSAGAMLFVVAAEIIPHTRQRIEHGSATPALMVGLAVMMALDVSLS